ncbi:MAG: PBP1A family penicillin-binding protein [Campylobacteraceae bacterium]|jgi:penicillin-binding protein 1A|nr:PBP1A family penicillin-binding protein [Campylobacteraceae bacterium]
MNVEEQEFKNGGKEGIIATIFAIATRILKYCMKSKKRVIITALTVIFALFGIFAVNTYQNAYYQAFGLINYNPKLTTQFFDRNGELVANYFEDENRLYAEFEEIPYRMVEALVAIEDTVFFEHDGINVEAIFRATLKNIKSMKFSEGASTLTQQLIKNTLLTREKTLKRKLNEALIALIIERSLTKEQIMERYLNHIFFGHGYYGVKTAAEGYFRKSLNELTLKEIAMLVGIPRQPNSYDPTKHLNLTLMRANAVLGRMKNLGWITEDEYNVAINEQVTVYDDTLSKNQAPYAVDEAIREANLLYDDVRSGGYKIYLSIDLKTQQLASEALEFGYQKILERDKDANTSILNGAIVVLDNFNGDILALTGGHNYTQSPFNRAVLTNRQLGSSFKPFLYQIALDSGYSTMDLIPDISRIYVEGDTEKNEAKEWAPKNIESNFQGLITLKDALMRSRNLATINLVTSIGLETVHKELTKMGFKNVPHDLSISLGSLGMSPLEYSKFYGMFANGGTLIEPRMIQKIVNRYGVEQLFESKKEQILDPAQNYLMIDMLKTVVESGTGRAAKVNGIEIAGKTGTSNNNIDAWFCGITPNINVMVWYGNDDNTPMASSEVGGRTATQPFAYFIQNYLKIYPETNRRFPIPNGVKKGVYNGKEEYFTAKSPFPSTSKAAASEDNILF